MSAVLFVNPKSSCLSNRRTLDAIFSAQYHNFLVDIFFDSRKKTLAFSFSTGVASTTVQGLKTLRPFLDGERVAWFSVELVEHSHRNCSLAIWGSERNPQTVCLHTTLPSRSLQRSRSRVCLLDVLARRLEEAVWIGGLFL